MRRQRHRPPHAQPPREDDGWPWVTTGDDGSLGVSPSHPSLAVPQSRAQLPFNPMSPEPRARCAPLLSRDPDQNPIGAGMGTPEQQAPWHRDRGLTRGPPSPAGVSGRQPPACKATGDAPWDARVGTGWASLAGFGRAGRTGTSIPVSVLGWAEPCRERCGRVGCEPGPGCVPACHRLAPNEDEWAG